MSGIGSPFPSPGLAVPPGSSMTGAISDTERSDHHLRISGSRGVNTVTGRRDRDAWRDVRPDLAPVNRVT